MSKDFMRAFLDLMKICIFASLKMFVIFFVYGCKMTGLLLIKIGEIIQRRLLR